MMYYLHITCQINKIYFWDVNIYNIIGCFSIPADVL